MQLFAVLLTALALVSSTTASPLAVTPDASRRSEDIVYSPPITSPSQGAVWKIGSKQLVTWDNSSIPAGAERNTGTIMLGYDDNTGSEHLDYREFDSVDPTASHNSLWGRFLSVPCLHVNCVEHLLADGFLLMAGQQYITVPKVTKRSTYIVAGK
jgi:hypothetical protein